MNIDNRSVHLIDNFLKPHECDQIIAYANSIKKHEEFLGRKIYLCKNISILNSLFKYANCSRSSKS